MTLMLLLASLAFTVALSLASSPSLSIVAEIAGSQNQFTGVAVSASGRIFVNFPRWNAPDAISVAELKIPHDNDLQVVPYPNLLINQFNSSDKAFLPVAGSRFVCVQSVVIDSDDFLWVLDTGAPYLATVISPQAPKLVKVDISIDKVVRVYHFPDTIAQNNSYLNDVRFDEARQVAYITDSASNGAIIVLDLKSGHARRLLSGTPEAQYDPNFVAHIGNVTIRARVNSDGIALSRDKKNLYFQALYANHMFSIETRYLLDETLSSAELLSHVVPCGETTMTDGMEIDQLGRVYFSAIEKFAITRCSVKAAGPMLLCNDVVQDERIKWPDSFAWRGNTLYFTTSQIFLEAQFNNGTDRRTDPYRLWKIEGLF